MKLIFLTVALLFLIPAFAGDEIQAIDNLIVASEKQLKTQKELKQDIILFETQKEIFLKGEQTLDHAGRMIKTATFILTSISDNHLQYLFSFEYLEELALFSSIGAKKGP